MRQRRLHRGRPRTFESEIVILCLLQSIPGWRFKTNSNPLLYQLPWYPLFFCSFLTSLHCYCFHNRFVWQWHPQLRDEVISSGLLSYNIISFVIIVILFSSDVILPNLNVNIWFSGSVARSAEQQTDPRELGHEVAMGRSPLVITKKIMTPPPSVKPKKVFYLRFSTY